MEKILRFARNSLLFYGSAHFSLATQLNVIDVCRLQDDIDHLGNWCNMLRKENPLQKPIGEYRPMELAPGTDDPPGCRM